MGKPVRTQFMSPEFVKDADPAHLGALVKSMIEEPEEEPFGIVLICTAEEAMEFAETNLWHYAPPEGVV